MNKIILMGRLARDPELRYAQRDPNMALARFTLAVERKATKGNANQEQKADFFSCVAFGKQAEFVSKYFTQGKRMLVTGRVQLGFYTNKDGNRVNTTDVYVEEVEFADSKNGNSGGSDVSGRDSGPIGDDFMNIPDGFEDGLPFN